MAVAVLTSSRSTRERGVLHLPGCAFLAVCVWLAVPYTAQADPFLVTSGAVGLATPGAKFQEGILSLQGSGLDVGLVLDWFPGANLPSGFAPGDTVDLSSTVMPGGWGVARVENERYGEVNFSGRLEFAAVPFVFQDTGLTTVSTPFIMTGELFGHFRKDPSQLAFSIQLVGAGTMSVLDLLRFPPGSPTEPAFYSAHRAIQLMTFEEAAAPVPEPGTLLLFAAGCAAVCGHIKRIRARSP